MPRVKTKTEIIVANLNRFYQSRKALGISQREQAREMGWSAGTLNQYLLGNCPINYDALFIMCDYYQVSPFAVDPDLWGRVMKHSPR